MKRFLKTTLAIACASTSFYVLGASQTEDSLPTIGVTADFRDSTIIEIPSSISVIDDESIQQRSAKHLEELLNLAPNVNYSSGSSRARFYQIRGIGERSQFVEPLNASVGVIIDDIDFSGIGTGGTLLDIQQVEVLRGPQGTRYGANALAGLINLKSYDPSEKFEGKLSASVGEYDSRQLSAVLSGPMSETLQYRLAIEENQSDGYTENDFLHRDDTNNRDEFTVRGKLHWVPNENFAVDLTTMYIDIDNGYDAFSLDNTRHTLSDQPGHDRQETTGLAIKTEYSGYQDFDVEVIVSTTQSDLEYGYDEDWSYSDICTGKACDGWAYSSFDNYQRDRDQAALEVRFISKDGMEIFNNTTQWVLGFYTSNQDENLERDYSGIFTSDYETNRYSVFSEFNTQITERLALTTGLRLEQHQADYSDSDNVNFDWDEDLWGGKLALEYLINDDVMVYGLISKGYKTGGVNSNSSLRDSERNFDTESMINYETGVKSSLLNDTLTTQISAFYQTRDDVQVKQSAIVPLSGTSCPCQFIDYTSNAAEGINYGLEAEFEWQALESLKISGSLGLLETELKDFINADGVDLDGREQAHAPSYQFSLGALYQINGAISAHIGVEGKDEFYFSDRHEEKSSAFEIWNARLNYRSRDWEVALWGRNLLNKDYEVRGFGSFGNDPRKFYVTEPYYQYGEPRVVGVTANYNF